MLGDVLDASQIAPESFRPITRAEYDRLVRDGFFDEDEHVELLYGVIVRMTPQDPPHSSVVQKLTHALVPPLASRAHVRIQLPFAASQESEPEPDVAIVPIGDYDASHPSAALLVIEVAHTSQRKDRQVKAKLYAECGVPEYWIVDVPARTVEVHTLPRGGAYTSVEARAPGESVTLASFPDVSIAVDALF